MPERSAEPVVASSRGALITDARDARPGRFELTPSHILFYRRGHFWQRREQVLDIELSAVASVERGDRRVLAVTMRDGTVHRLDLERYDAFTAQLRMGA